MMKKSILFCLGLLSLAPAWGRPQNEIYDAEQIMDQEIDQEIPELFDKGNVENAENAVKSLG